MRIVKREESELVHTLRAIYNYRSVGTCDECKTTFEADWWDLEGFLADRPHVHCPVCGKSMMAAVTDEILNYLRSLDVEVLVDGEMDEEDYNV